MKKIHETIKNKRKHAIKGNIHQLAAKKLIMSRNNSSLDKIHPLSLYAAATLIVQIPSD